MQRLLLTLVLYPVLATADCDFPEEGSSWELDFEHFVSSQAGGNETVEVQLREVFAESFDETGLPRWEFNNGRASFTAYGSTLSLVYQVLDDCKVSFTYRQGMQTGNEVREFSSDEGRLCFVLVGNEADTETRECFLQK